ncbi:MAG TPA: sporulation protein [Chondromyces sp.]|nr:sporulation protein [Chondromyces sp.]
MILRKYLSLVGIGAAKIDLVLPKDTYSPGERINGLFLINGGTVEQQIKRIDCDLVMVDHPSGKEEVIDSTTILTTQMIESEKVHRFPFAFSLPAHIPLSSMERSYRFKTKLTFDKGVESIDQDMIKII